MKTLEAIINRVVAYRDAQGWQRNDKPNNVAKSIAIEAAELLENYQWSKEPVNLENVKEELADVLMYALTMVYDENIDLEEAFKRRIRERESTMKRLQEKGEK